MEARHILACLALLPALCATERWGIYEVSLRGPATGNPYLDVRLSAHFQIRNRTVDADGFYDGGGANYRMPLRHARRDWASGVIRPPTVM